MLARPMRSVCSTGITDAFGTGHDDSGWQINSTSCPAAWRPRANVSSTASVPPYAGAGTGTHGGAMMAMSKSVSRLVDAQRIVRTVLGPAALASLPERPRSLARTGVDD